MHNIKNLYTFSGQDIQVVFFDTNKLQTQMNLAASKNNNQSTKSIQEAELSLDFQNALTDNSNFSSKTTHYKPAPLGTTNQITTNQQLDMSKKAIDERKYVNNVLNDNSTSNSCEASQFESKIFYNVGNLDSFSYSTFREKVAVRSLGRSQAVGYTRGARTIAGTMVFNVMQDNELLRFFQDRSNGPVLMDQIKPFNVVLFLSNEYGGTSLIHLYNVEFGAESQRMSIHDIIVQNVVNFYATDLIPIQDTGNIFQSINSMHNFEEGRTKLNQLHFCPGTGEKQLKKIDSLINVNKPDSDINQLLQRSRFLG